MSNRKIKTSLEGYDRQVFPKGLDQLNRAYDEITNCGESLLKLGEEIAGFETMDRPTTRDKYIWFWALHFKIGEGKAATLFPWAQDWKKRNGIQLDRSIATYTKGEVDTQDVDRLVESLYQGFQKLQVASASSESVT